MESKISERYIELLMFLSNELGVYVKIHGLSDEILSKRIGMPIEKINKIFLLKADLTLSDFLDILYFLDLDVDVIPKENKNIKKVD